MDKNVLVINKSGEKYNIKEEINNFFEKYEEHYYPIVRVKTIGGNTIIGIASGTRYALYIENFFSEHETIEFKNISSVKILHNRELFQVIHSLTKKTAALSEKRLKEITKNMKDLIKTAKNQ